MADVKQPTNDEKDGCTCGHCIDGWLSPRMKERLEGEADYLRFISTKIIEEELKDLKPDEVIPEWCIATDSALQYIPTSFEQKMTLSFYKAYTVVIEAVLLILIQDTTTASCIPTVSTVQTHLGLPTNVNTESESEAKAFFDAGGEIAFALEALVDRAYEKSPEGGEYRRKAALRREEEDFESEVVELPRCRYDLDFGLVRMKLGLSVQGKGPCWFFLTDDEDSGDDDDEEGEEGEEGDEGAMYVGNQATSASEE